MVAIELQKPQVDTPAVFLGKEINWLSGSGESSRQADLLLQAIASAKRIELPKEGGLVRLVAVGMDAFEKPIGVEAEVPVGLILETQEVSGKIGRLSRQVTDLHQQMTIPGSKERGRSLRGQVIAAEKELFGGFLRLQQVKDGLLSSLKEAETPKVSPDLNTPFYQRTIVEQSGKVLPVQMETTGDDGAVRVFLALATAATAIPVKERATQRQIPSEQPKAGVVRGVNELRLPTAREIIYAAVPVEQQLATRTIILTAAQTREQQVTDIISKEPLKKILRANGWQEGELNQAMYEVAVLNPVLWNDMLRWLEKQTGKTIDLRKYTKGREGWARTVANYGLSLVKPGTELTIPIPGGVVVPEKTPTAVKEKTPTSVHEMGVGEMGFGGPATDILRNLTTIPAEINKSQFERANQGARLLTPTGLDYQGFTYLKSNDGKPVAVINGNMPIYPDGVAPARFNTPDCVFLMCRQENGVDYFHVPMVAGGQTAAVFMRGETLKIGSVNGNGVITSEKDYWQRMPTGAVKAAMVKFGNAVYVTFWDINGNQLENQRIKVCDLPAEATAVPTKVPIEATPVPKAKGVEVVDNFEGADIWAADPARLKQAQDLVFKEKFGRTNGIVDTLLQVSNIDNPDYHNVQVQLDLSKGMRVVFYNVEGMTPDVQMKYREGISMYSAGGIVVKTRCSEDGGQLVLEIFCPKPAHKAGFSSLLVCGLLKLMDIRTDVTKIEGNKPYQELLSIAWRYLPSSMSDIELVDPFIGASF